MNGRAIDAATAYMRKNWHLITDDESKYKLTFVEESRADLRDVEEGRSTWHRFLKKHRTMVNHSLGWRVGDQLVKLADDIPDALAAGCRDLAEPADADEFWERLTRALGPNGASRFDKLRSVGARASVASLFLFLKDPHHFPLYRSNNFGAPLMRLTAEPLDKDSPGRLLSSYYDAISRLSDQFEQQGLAVRSPLDVQGILWVVTYKRVLET